MTASYPITEARGQLGELARRAAQHENIVLTDRGQPAAVMISPAVLEDMEDALAVARLERDRALGIQAEPVADTDARALFAKAAERGAR
ncbi:type II toxin-antitoxin system Phd/YefM family antitoxin [Streptomyces sp. NBC_01558]|uniref:type II toxin-antitoxin system Phd/YefM family antitoxin n=1 Tax=Streptomyces sp. NBC_01558 TaxID=2975878 RepID=UPI002DDBEA46|nr:type II toxin-antitoxin system prevent-host-death family antitoxin [Streptomyces sp. NBC_01558]WSD74985.1 type II toxin-antitoxin system Phd/YefM family antitoxin [Streptomyces sp. NBC_01558]